jgi:hypothetical protein
VLAGRPVAPSRARRGTPRKFLRSCWAGEGLWAYQEGQMGQKMVCFGQLRPTRSRQDESIEAGEVGPKQPPLGGTGGHVVRWIGLIFRLLGCNSLRDRRWPLVRCSSTGAERREGGVWARPAYVVIPQGKKTNKNSCGCVCARSPRGPGPWFGGGGALPGR